jgi:tRNA dimethylallyltransferase
MSSGKHLIVIGGPTASGKTSLAITVAQHFKTTILSADSRQFYKEMSIGTAKPSAEELAAAPHLFINHLSVKDTYTVADYEREALSALDNIFSKQDVAVLAGGSGLFIKALCEGLDDFPQVSDWARQKVEELYESEGIEGLQKALELADPAYYNTVDLQNARRLLRALMVCESSGQAYSSFLSNEAKQRAFTPHYICLNMDRALLYNRINDRVDQIFVKGLLEEARSLYPYKDLKSLQTVGYAELFDYFDEKQDLETAIDLIKRNSRRYAKRQLTWFNRDEHWKMFSPEDTNEVIRYLESRVVAKG